MDWIEWMWKVEGGKWMWKVESGKWLVESGAVPDLTLIRIRLERKGPRDSQQHKKLSYRRKTALQGASVLAKSGRIGLGNDILRTL